MKRFFSVILLFLMLHPVLQAQTLAQARSWYLKKEYQKALPVFRNELKRRPKDANLNLWYGVCLLETGKTRQAEELLRFARTRNLPDAELFLAKYFLKTAAPDSCLVALDRYLALPKLDDAKKDEAIALRAEAENALSQLRKVEDICFIDSVVVPKSALYQTVKLSPEAGTLTGIKQVFNDASRTLGAAYLPEKNDRGFYASLIQGKGFDIVARHRFLNEWDDEEPLSDIINSEADEQNPFFLSDGTTLYFASNRSGTLGGYDLYLTRMGSNGSYLLPDHLNMPFNSKANDYFLLIDEFSNRGYLATDRNQPKGYACIYTFIPNAGTVLVQDKSLRELQDLANIRSIRASQVGKNLDSLMRQPEKTIRRTSEQEPDLIFILNDQNQYTKETDFKNPEARELYRSYRSLYNQRQKDATLLEELRRQWTEAGEAERKKLVSDILKSEQELTGLREKLPVMEAEIRRLELESIRK